MKTLLKWGVLATALMIVAGGSARAQLPGQSIPATKVGVVNIGVVFTKYEKAAAYKKELEQTLLPLKAQAEKLKENTQGHVEWLKKNPNGDANQKAICEKAVRDNQRALEDLDLQARNLVGKKQETQLIALYKEIHAAVAQHAQQNGFHVIFAYGDPPDGDLFTFQQINRKMGGMDVGAAVPFYTATGLDISQDVLARLNTMYRQAGGGIGNGGVVTPTGFGPKQ